MTGRVAESSAEHRHESADGRRTAPKDLPDAVSHLDCDDGEGPVNRAQPPFRTASPSNDTTRTETTSGRTAHVPSGTGLLPLPLPLLT